MANLGGRRDLFPLPISRSANPRESATRSPRLLCRLASSHLAAAIAPRYPPIPPHQPNIRSTLRLATAGASRPTSSDPLLGNDHGLFRSEPSARRFLSNLGVHREDCTPLYPHSGTRAARQKPDAPRSEVSATLHPLGRPPRAIAGDIMQPTGLRSCRSKADKLIAGIRARPVEGDFDDVAHVLQHFGLERIREAGSHTSFGKTGEPSIVIPKKHWR